MASAYKAIKGAVNKIDKFSDEKKKLEMCLNVMMIGVGYLIIFGGARLIISTFFKPDNSELLISLGYL